MFSIPRLIILIPFLPLAGSVLTAILGPKLLRRHSHWPTLIAVVCSFVCSVLLASQVRHELTQPANKVGYERTVTLWNWASLGVSSTDGAAQQLDPPFQVDVTLRTDSLTVIMLLMVTFISSLVVLYSVGYMRGDRGFWRFFAYVGLFVFSMTMLVSVSNFLLLFVFWEAVGVCSYLLIGYWYERNVAAAAGMKAFLVNRVGDFGFALGIFLIFVAYGTWNFHDTETASGTVAGVFGATRLAGGAGGYVAGGLGTAICLLLMLGACGKSAQFPLHVWLPDAMEGPTPVSALIHAATMVTAGVYMVARCTPLFLVSQTAQVTVAAIGAGTALMAGLIAVTQYDLKRVLAYSTISQLGYMFLGLGCGTMGGIAAGMFHLFTHAFFKALLFLGAGSVMHAMGDVIDMRKFGGLRRLLPITHWTFLFGCVALAGLIPFSGFWSKDAILGAVHDQAQAMTAELHKRPDQPAESATQSLRGTLWLVSRSLDDDHVGDVDQDHGPTTAHLGHLSNDEIRLSAKVYGALYWIAMATACLTSIYTFRMFFLTFYGPVEVPAEAGGHAHESPPTMWVPLVILAAFAAGLGFLLHVTHLFHKFLGFTPSLASDALRLTPQPGVFHMNVAMTSSMLAGLGLAISAFLYLGRTSEVTALARLFSSPWLGAPYVWSKGKFFWDEIYDLLLVRPLKLGANLCFWLDQHLVDGLVNFVGRLVRFAGVALRGLQMGFVPFYALAMVLGIITLVASRIWWGG